jgi:hypothetical protein
MLTRIMSWVAFTILLLAVLGLQITAEHRLLTSLVCASGLLIVWQAIRAGNFSWAVGFIVIAMLFNPVVSIFRSGSDIWLLNWIALVMFLWAAVRLNTQRPLTLRSITNLIPRRASL